MVAMQKDKRREGKAPKPTLEPINTAGENGNTAFARALGSTDYMTREKGVQALTRWLQLRADIPENDMLKLWKGLYFCFWHSDKAPVQVGKLLLGLLLTPSTNSGPHRHLQKTASVLTTMHCFTGGAC